MPLLVCVHSEHPCRPAPVHFLLTGAAAPVLSLPQYVRSARAQGKIVHVRMGSRSLCMPDMFSLTVWESVISNALTDNVDHLTIPICPPSPNFGCVCLAVLESRHNILQSCCRKLKSKFCQHSTSTFVKASKCFKEGNRDVKVQSCPACGCMQQHGHHTQRCIGYSRITLVFQRSS